MASGTLSRAQTAIGAVRSTPIARQFVAPSRLGCPSLRKLQEACQHATQGAPLAQSRRQLITRAEAGNGAGPSGLSITLKGGGSFPGSCTDHSRSTNETTKQRISKNCISCAAVTC